MQVMGVVNVTPDSFSDGGRYLDADRAVAHGQELLAHGADILDIGGESTRPGATRPLVSEELDRVVPVIERLAGEGARVSVDTMRAEVARAALDAGAQIVNDVSGGLADPKILGVVAEAGATYVAMHWRAHSEVMQDFTQYDGPVAAVVAAELAERVAAVRAAGIADDRLVLDPGLGFAKTADQNWELLRDLAPIEGLGFPLLVGASRKRFLGHLLAATAAGDTATDTTTATGDTATDATTATGDTATDTATATAAERPVDQREHAHVALLTLLARRGVWGVRVHDVRAATDALRVLERLEGKL